VNETYESFVCSVIFGCKWEQAFYVRRSWTTKTGYMMGVLQLAAAAQDGICCGTGRCVLRVFGVGEPRFRGSAEVVDRVRAMSCHVL
jgi:hypothetical protein